MSDDWGQTQCFIKTVNYDGPCNREQGLYLIKTGHYEDQYRAGDSRAMWRAIQCCTKNDIPLPGWISDYLANAADELLNIDSPNKYFQSEVVRILGVKAKDFSDEHKNKRDNEIISYVLKHGGTMEDSFYAAADEFGLSYSTVKNLYHKARKVMKANFEELKCDPAALREKVGISDEEVELFLTKDSG